MRIEKDKDDEMWC